MFRLLVPADIVLFKKHEFIIWGPITYLLSLSKGGKRITAKEEIQSIHWATWTGVLGSEVNGIWPKYTQVNDINATDASFDHQVIATGDDFGLVKLFRFPCVKKGQFRSLVLSVWCMRGYHMYVCFGGKKGYI